MTKKQFLKEMNEIIEQNKANHFYWEREDWIYDAIKEIPTRKDLTGNKLTEYFMNEVNKLNGVMVEREFDENTHTLNAYIWVVTPYSNYSYRFNRGYDGRCELHKAELTGTSSNKSRTYIKLAKEHLCEIVYGETLKVLNSEYNHSIMEK